MGQPTPYTITTDFSADEAANLAGRSTVKTVSLDIEFENLKTTLDGVLANLALLQRNDGKIKNGIGAPHLFNLSSKANGFLKYSSGSWSFEADPTGAAQTAQAAAEIAQAAAEAAQTLAESYRDDAETAKLAAETAQTAAELAQQSIPTGENIQSGALWYALSTGTATAYELTLGTVPPSIASGLFVHMKAHVTNTGPATLNVNSLGAKSIKTRDGSDLKAGDIQANSIFRLIYDGTNFILPTSGTKIKDGIDLNTGNIFRAFEEIQENHGGALLMEAGWSDSFSNANEQGADEANSTGFQHDNVNKLYKGTDPGTGLNSDRNYDTETNFLQQEWTNTNQTTSQATVASGTTITLSSGTWPTNCGKARISFDSGSTFYDINSRDSATQLTLASSAPNGTFDYIIRATKFEGGVFQLNSFASGGKTVTCEAAAPICEIDTSQFKFGNSSLRLHSNSNAVGLTIQDHSDWATGTGSFTLEAWVRWNTNPGHIALWDQFQDDNNRIMIWMENNTTGLSRIEVRNAGSFVYAYNWQNGNFTPLNSGQWYHIAIVRNGSNDPEWFTDGVARTNRSLTSGSAGNSFPDFSIPFSIGQGSGGSGAFDGWIDEFRFSNTARWTSNFTPPTTPYLTDSNTKLLLHFEGDDASTNVIDSSIMINTTNEYISAQDIEIQKTNTSSWIDINSGSVTETLNSQNAYYWLAFDPASGFGDGTEIKIFNSTDSVWRVIAKNNSGTWEYNNDSSNSATYTGTSATVNDMLHAISQAMSTQTGNRMTGTNLAAITDTQWEEANGWSTSVNSIVRGVTLYSNNTGQNPSVSQYRLNYDSNRDAMDLRSKTYNPDFVPSEAYVWSRAEHSDADGPGTFSVTRNGGTEWTTVSMTQQGLPLAGDIRILRGTVNISGQTSGQDLRCRYQTTVEKDQYLHSWGLQAKT